MSWRDIPEQFQHHVKNGEHYGYPSCCIRAQVEFVIKVMTTGDKTDTRAKGWWRGTGFQPCELHAKMLTEQGFSAIKNILVDRKCPMPWPYDEEHVDDLVERMSSALRSSR